MKQILLSFALLLFLTSQAFSQNVEGYLIGDWDPAIYRVGERYPGYIIKLDGDTVHGFLQAQNRCSIGGMGSSNQNAVVFYVNKTDRKPAAKYKPADLKGYRIADKEYESINFSGGLLKKPNFNLVIEDGPIRLYEWYSTVPGFSLILQQSGEHWKDYDKRRFEKRIVVAKDPKAPIEYGMLGLSFSKNMSAMVADNPELSEKVKSKAKGYTYLNLFEVISEYNNWARSKQ